MSYLLVDSHCHLDLIDADPGSARLEASVADARAQGVAYMLSVSVGLDAFPRIREHARRFEGVFASVGVHPNERPEAEPDIDTLVRLSREPDVVAIGETGLDYFRSSGDLEWQRQRFRRHIAAAREAHRPLIIHCREAAADTIRIMSEQGADQVGGVMHCFVEDWETARRAMDLGFYISFSGIVTFKNAHPLKDVAVRVPLERMLLETDAPYLAPMPYRGKPNAPAYVRFVAEHIAELRGETVQAVADATTQNFFALFPAAARLEDALSPEMS